LGSFVPLRALSSFGGRDLRVVGFLAWLIWHWAQSRG
jgi:hypothetical protein